MHERIQDHGLPILDGEGVKTNGGVEGCKLANRIRIDQLGRCHVERGALHAVRI